jgi:hypothetical protein
MSPPSEMTKSARRVHMGLIEDDVGRSEVTEKLNLELSPPANPRQMKQWYGQLSVPISLVWLHLLVGIFQLEVQHE